MFFVKLKKVEFLSYDLTYVLRILGVIRVCTIAQVYKFFCGKENSSVLQSLRSLGDMEACESMFILLKPGAYQFSILGLLKCAQPETTHSSINMLLSCRKRILSQ